MTFSKSALLSVCLFVSLIGNGLLGGMAAGKHFAPHEAGGRNFLQPVFKLVDSLPADERTRLQAILKPGEAALQEKRRSLQQRRDHIHDIMLRKDVDKKQLEEAFTGYRALSADMQKTTQSLITDTILALSPEDRRRLVEAIKQRP